MNYRKESGLGTHMKGIVKRLIRCSIFVVLVLIALPAECAGVGTEIIIQPRN